MKELTLHEMESISGAGILSLPCALASFTVQSAFGLVKAGVEAGINTAIIAIDGAFDVVANLFSDAAFDPNGIFTDHMNELSFSLSGTWSSFVAEAATDWGQVTYSLHK